MRSPAGRPGMYPATPSNARDGRGIAALALAGTLVVLLGTWDVMLVARAPRTLSSAVRPTDPHRLRGVLSLHSHLPISNTKILG